MDAPFKTEKYSNNFDMRHHATIKDEEMLALLRENDILLKKNQRVVVILRVYSLVRDRVEHHS